MSALVYAAVGFLFGGRKPPPQLSYGKPLDFGADVPVFPPFAMMLTMLTGRLLWFATGKRLPFTPKLLRTTPVRVALFAIGLAITKFVVLDGAGGELTKAGSGTLFTPVEGLATEGLFSITRERRYSPFRASRESDPFSHCVSSPGSQAIRCTPPSSSSPSRRSRP